MKIFYDKTVVHSIKCLGEIYKGKDDSMGLRLLNSGVDKVKEADKVVGYRSAFQSTTVGWVKIGKHNRHQPVT